MIYQTKKKKINNNIQSMIKTLILEKKDKAKRDLIIANICIDLGVSEADVVEALGLFEKAGILKLSEKEIVLY